MNHDLILAPARRIPGWLAYLEHPSRLFVTLTLGLMVVFQAVTHLGWLSISTQSGQMVVPWLLARGGVFFDTVIEDRAPGIGWVLALIQRIAPTEPLLTLRALNLMLVVMLTCLIYAGARRLINPLSGLLAALFWVAFEPVFGNILLYFNSVLGALFMLAILTWWGLEQRGPVWLAPLSVGLIMGGSVLVKQQGAAVLFLVGVWIAVFARRRRLQALFVYGIAALAPSLLVAVAMQAQGLLGDYGFWNWSHNVTGDRPLSIWTGDWIRKLLFTIAFVPVFACLAGNWINGRKAGLVLLVWLGTWATQLPSNGEIYAMAQLPLVALMTGAAGALLLREVFTLGPTIGRQTLFGLVSVVFLGWGWVVVSAYVPASLGRAAVPAWDEFQPVAARLRALAAPDDTLYVLPELDGSAQLHVLADLEPPGLLWVPGHYWFLNAPGVVERLLGQWDEHPPTFLVHFPEMAIQSEPYIEPLVQYMEANYVLIETVPDVPFNGDAEIWRLNPR